MRLTSDKGDERANLTATMQCLPLKRNADVGN